MQKGTTAIMNLHQIIEEKTLIMYNYKPSLLVIFAPYHQRQVRTTPPRLSKSLAITGFWKF